ncbi:PIN domain-containing protein [Lonepinella koalarum]|uniref:PIN domain-containing protein n=1 Tax=Lonepinella koalarum TaxID=53417 RepID=UPI001A9CC97F
MLSDLTCLDVSKTVINHCIQIRRRHKIKLPDALILATAKVHGLQLLTLDEKLQRIYERERD